MYPQILALDRAGQPNRWIDVESAATYVCKGLVSWSLGATCATLRGGWRQADGLRSTVEVPSIIAVTGSEFRVRHEHRPPAVSRRMLFERDRHLCAYCGKQFRETQLSVEHVIPRSRGGADSWMNFVTACKRCNSHKADRTPEEAGMRLLYVPYVPNRHEGFILANRKILADQMAFLLDGVSPESRLLSLPRESMP